MANWNLSVDLRGTGNDLAKKLRQGATEARNLGAAAGEAQDKVTDLGNASAAAAGEVKTLGSEAKTTAQRLQGLDRDANAARSSVKKLGAGAETAAGRLDTLATQARQAAKDMRALERAVALTDTQIRALANHVSIAIDLDDQTASGIAAVRAAITELELRSPVNLTATLDDQTGPGMTDIRAALAELDLLSPVQLTATLDNQTGPGTADIRAALAELNLLSPIQLNATLDDQTGTGIAAVRTAVTDLRALSPINLTVNFDGDATQIAAAAAAMDDLQSNANGAGTALGGLTTRSVAAAVALRDVQQAAQDASRELRTVRGRAAAAAAAFDDLALRARAASVSLRSFNTTAGTADRRLGDLSTRTRTLRGDLDDLDGSLTRAGGRMGGLRGTVGSLTTSVASAGGAMENLGSAALILSPALLPIAASVAPIAAGMVAAAVGVGVFGGAIAGQIKALTDATQAQTKYDDAVAQHGQRSPEAAAAEKEFLAQVSKMPPATQEAAASLSVLTDNYTSWSDSLAGDTMPVATQAFALFSALFPKMTPLVQGSSRELGRFLTIAGGGVASPAFDKFMKSFADFSEHALSRANDELIRFTRTLDTGKVGGNVSEFMTYAKQNGPLVASTFKELTGALTNLLVGASDVGVSMLTIVNILAKLLNAVPPDVIAALLQLAIAIKTVKIAAAGGAAIQAFFVALRVQAMAAGTAAIGASGAMATLRVAIGALSTTAKVALAGTALGLLVIGIAAISQIGKKAPPDVDRLTTSLGTLATTGKVSGEAARIYGKDLAGLGESLRVLARPSNAQGVQQWMTQLIGMDSTPVKEAKENFDAADKSLASLVQSGNADVAKAAFDRIAVSVRKQGMTTKELREEMGDYRASLADQAFEQQLVADSMGLFGDQAVKTKNKLDAQKVSTDGLRQSIVALNDVNRAALGGMVGFEAAIDAATAGIKGHENSLKMVNGELVLNGAKARESATLLQDLATKTDGAATSARDSGKSWQYVNGIYEEGRAAFLKTADAMGLTKAQAEQLADSIQDIPHQKQVILEMRTEDAITGLNSVIAAIDKTPNAKSVTVKALTDDAIAMLSTLGFTVKQMPDGQFKVTANTGTASAGLAAVQAARNGLKDKTLTINTATQNAIISLQDVQAKLRATKGKSVTVTALTKTAEAALEQLGFKVTHMKNGKATVTIPTGTPKAAISAIQGAINNVHGTSASIVITTSYRTNGQPPPGPYAAGYKFKADGGVTDYYAQGGVRDGRVTHFAGGAENHVAQIARGGDWRVWAEDETGGESYIPLAPSKRKRSRKIAEETVRRLGGKGIAWQANGGFTYAPTELASMGTTDAMARYDSLVGRLKDAWAQYNQAVKNFADIKKDKKSTAAQRASAQKKVATEAAEVKALDAKLGLKAGAAAPTTLNLVAYQKQLTASVAATTKWQKDLAKIGARGGADIQELLKDMGTEGFSLVSQLANASDQQFKDITANLLKVGKTAKATLADFTTQINAATKTSDTFQANLIKLAGMGFGDLATQLASQGDDAAQALAAEAVTSTSKASAANTAAAAAGKSLTQDELSQLVQIIAAVKSPTTGIHDVAATTGLGEDDIIATAGKAAAQIRTSLGDRANKFLADLARGQAGMSYANGGIRAGIYGTQDGIIKFAEPETHGEAYVPLGANKRTAATNTLRDVASRFGLGLTDMSSTRPVVIIRQDGATHVSVTAVRSGATASDIGSQVGRSVRRARRGGVAARAGR